MKTNVFLGIAIRIIILFGVTILATFLPEYLNNHYPAFLGDYIDDREDKCWGLRHWWWFIMMVILFALSLLNVVLSIYTLVKKNYNL